MLQQRSIILIGLAVLLGLAAVFIANSYLTGVQKKAEVVPVGTTNVVIARVPMDFGTEIKADMVRVVKLPTNAVPEGAFTWPGQLTPNGKPRVALRQISVNEPILQNAVSGEGGRATLSSTLNPDMRAVAFRISDVAGVAGFILPGDLVDVMITRSIGGEDGQTVTDVLLQKVRVIAIDQNASQASSQPNVGKTATLELSQIDAQKITLGASVGSLHLALRRVEDQNNPMVRTVGMEDLRDGAYGGGFRSPGPQYRPSFSFSRALAAATAAPAAAAPAAIPAAPRGPAAAPVKPKPRGPVIEIFRGTSGTQYEVGGNVRF